MDHNLLHHEIRATNFIIYCKLFLQPQRQPLIQNDKSQLLFNQILGEMNKKETKNRAHNGD